MVRTLLDVRGVVDNAARRRIRLMSAKVHPRTDEPLRLEPSADAAMGAQTTSAVCVPSGWGVKTASETPAARPEEIG